MGLEKLQAWRTWRNVRGQWHERTVTSDEERVLRALVEITSTWPAESMGPSAKVG